MPNPGVTTLGDVRSAAASRADMVTSSTTTFVTTAEWNANINASYFELYDLLVQKFGDDYYFAGTPDNWFEFTTTTVSSYVLPDGSSTYKLLDNATTAPAFYKMMGVDVLYGSDWLELKSFAFIERNTRGTQVGTGTRGHMAYRIVGPRIWLTPPPQSGQRVRCFYVPRMTTLVSDGDLLDGVSGWEEYVIVDAAIKALIKEESDISALEDRKAHLVERIETAAGSRDAGAPQRVGDARNTGWASSWPDGWR